MQEVLNGQEQVDVNHQDGLGNTGESESVGVIKWGSLAVMAS